MKEKLIYLLLKFLFEVLIIVCIFICINVEKFIDIVFVYLFSYKVFEIFGLSIRVRKLRLRVFVKLKDIVE